MEISDVRSFFLLPVVLDLRPLGRELLVAGSYPGFGPDRLHGLVLGRNRYDETMCMIS